MLPSPQSANSPAPNHARRVKLRNACNQCCTAKVKCSGQRSGCDRCRASGKQCIYSESRVGKVPGVRARRRESQDHALPLSESRTSSANTPASTIFGTSELCHQGLDQDLGRGPAQDDVADWNIDWQDDSSLGKSGNAHEGPSAADMAGSSTNGGDLSASDCITAMVAPSEFPLPAMDPSFEELLNFSPSIPAHIEQATELRPPVQVSKSFELRPRNEVDSQCCIECCQMFIDLENYIVSELKAFKLLLGIIRKALERLTHLLGVQQESRDLRCLMLLTTIMYQVLQLLEVCLEAVKTEGDKQRTRRLTGVSTGLGFGDFAIDEEEQMALRVQTILKETQQAMEVLRKLKVLAGMGPEDDQSAGSDSAQGQARQCCYDDLEVRFENLRLQCTRER